MKVCIVVLLNICMYCDCNSQVELDEIVRSKNLDLLINHTILFKAKKTKFPPDNFYTKNIFDRAYQYKRQGINGTKFEEVGAKSFNVIDTGRFYNEEGEFKSTCWYLKTIESDTKDTILVSVQGLFDFDFKLLDSIIPKDGYYCKDYLKSSFSGLGKLPDDKNIHFEKSGVSIFLYCSRQQGPSSSKGVKIVFDNKKSIIKPNERSKIIVSNGNYKEYFFISLSKIEFEMFKKYFVSEIISEGTFFYIENKYTLHDYAKCLTY